MKLQKADFANFPGSSDMVKNPARVEQFSPQIRTETVSGVDARDALRNAESDGVSSIIQSAWNSSVFLMLLVTCFFPFGHSKLTAQDAPKEFPVRVAFRLSDAGSGKPVPYASVRLMGTRKGIAADSNGFFSMVISQKDTLKISSIGYYDVIYTKRPEKHTSYFESIAMRSRIFELSPVQITAKRTLNLDNPFLRWEYRAKFQPKVWLFYEPDGSPPPSPGLNSPISFLYDRLSRRGREARKIRDMVAERARRKWYASRYNAAKVREWTGIGEEEIAEFMKFCPMPDAFLDEAGDYDIIERTFRCLEEFDQRESR
jgi:hypothetical protein